MYDLRWMGITPAWAGKRPVAHAGKELIEDHPRVGGEKRFSAVFHLATSGSPPRGRGKVRGLLFSSHCARITPAWAGKSVGALNVPLPPEDHPRMGGEKRNVGHTYQRKQGSPPHGRGKGTEQVRWGTHRGITPAWAGKSFQVHFAFISIGDHPRMGGEKRLELQEKHQ